MRTANLLLLISLTACSGCDSGGGGRQSPTPATALDLTGDWRVTGTILESDGLVAGTTLENTRATITFWTRSDVDLYSVVLDGVPARAIGPQPASILAGAPEPGGQLVITTGLCYVPANDVTVTLELSIDAAQLAVASATADRFVLLWDFDVYAGDAMVPAASEGVPEWALQAGAVRLGGGRLRAEFDRLP